MHLASRQPARSRACQKTTPLDRRARRQSRSADAPSDRLAGSRLPATRRRCSRSSSASSTSATAAGAASACATHSRRCSMPSTHRSSGEVDGVDKKVYWDVVDHCYLCDMCYMTKCPYVPPHPWNVDFPHLMLRAKAFKFNNQPVARARSSILSATDIGRQHRRHSGRRRDRQRGEQDTQSAASCSTRRSACIPRRRCPKYHSKHLSQAARRGRASGARGEAGGRHERPRRAVRHLLRQSQRAGSRRGSDRGLRAQRHRGDDRCAQERCCGMPKLELGDLEAIAQLKEQNIPGARGDWSTRAGTS